MGQRLLRLLLSCIAHQKAPRKAAKSGSPAPPSQQETGGDPLDRAGVECSSTTSVWIASVTMVESRIPAIPPTISASNAFRTCGSKLALAAIENYGQAHPVETPDTGTLRGDLLALLAAFSRARAPFRRDRRDLRLLGALAETGLTPVQVRDKLIGDRPSPPDHVIYRRATTAGRSTSTASRAPSSRCRSTSCATTC